MSEVFSLPAPTIRSQEPYETPPASALHLPEAMMSAPPTISLTTTQVQQYGSNGKHPWVPVSFTIPTVGRDPLAVMAVLQARGERSFLLESAEHDHERGRWSFIGLQPLLGVAAHNGHMQVQTLNARATAGGRANIPLSQQRHTPGPKQTKSPLNAPGQPHRDATADPSATIAAILQEFSSAKVPGMPPFSGGLVGYFGYEYLSYIETSLQLQGADEEHFQDVDLLLFAEVIAFDHHRQEVQVITNIDLRIPKDYAAAQARLYSLLSLIESPAVPLPPASLDTPFSPLFSRKEFAQKVQTAQNYIHEGDAFQIVLSNRWEADFSGSLLPVYAQLRQVNPSPYMFYFSGRDIEMAGASPETLVNYRGGDLTTFPLAGTRPRGEDEATDKALEQELLADEKELSEHNMLVDLGRNDLGRISLPGSVTVENYLQVLRFSHVMHIGSTVRGKLDRNRFHPVESIAAILPAGTLSGAPKLRATEIIDELEGCKRGVYGGAIGYLSTGGDIDTCIAIRLAFVKNGKVFVRAGAGIVADSQADNEYEECLHKAAAVMRAITATQISPEEEATS